MDGMHDLGGKQGFGPVRHTPGAPAFHAAWEKRVNALYSLAVRQGIFNMDEYRHAIERMEPRHYLTASYAYLEISVRQAEALLQLMSATQEFRCNAERSRLIDPEIGRASCRERV